MGSLILAAPVFLVFEVWQLFIAERYLGVKQIARGADPRELGLRESTAFFWTTGILVYWCWMLLLLTSRPSRVHGIALLAVSVAGFAFRRGAPLKWILVSLTIEGAIRVGLLFSLTAMAWWRR